MSFLTKLDMLYLEQKRDLKDSEIDYNFKCFIPIQPIGYSSKNKFFVKKSRKASLIINVGEQRIYFSDIDVVNTILDLPLEVRSDILKKLIEMYSENKAVNTKISIGTKQYDGFGLPYYDGENSIDVFSDSKIDLNDFVFIVNFILSKDKKSEEQGQKKTIRQLLGFPTAADFVLTRRMAEKSDNVYQLLNQLLEAYTPTAHQEVEEVTAIAKELEGEDFTLMPWDWAYYSEKLKEKKFNWNEEALRPYFELNRVIEGVFGLATRLYGITFQENKDIPVYHADVKAYEVFDRDGSFLAVLYTDFHPRASKRSGAWMTSYKEQWIDEKGNSRPHVSVTMNFTKPSADKPALLTFSEVNTFLHEFGHALHGMFANTTYQSLSGTNVYWDFVELPSQIMENFAIEKEFLNTFAKHYETGEDIPEEMIQRIVDASNFNVAYACLRQLSFGLLDMAWYTRTEPFEGDVRSYEKEAWKKTQILPDIAETCMTVQFSHIMAGGYSAGYYSYKWAEVLDADAFSLFKEKGIFHSETANSFRENVLSKGGTEHPMELYKRFRGQEPSIDALLKRNGIIN